MTRYQLQTVVLSSDDARFQDALARAHRGKDRPLCLCKEPPLPMYVARLADGYIIKRMPETGAQHAPSCESYEPPPEISGLGELVGGAIQEEVESGLTALKLGFSLSKRKGKTAPAAAGSEKQSVRTDGNKLTLRGCLHYLWDQAGLNTWTPGMAGKRSWGVVRRVVLGAAQSKTAKGIGLGEMIFMPEPFSLERKDEILTRRAAQLATLTAESKSTRKLLIFIGEVKEVAAARFGHKLIIKHLPDFPLMLADDIRNRLYQRFASQIDLWSADESTHLIAIGTFGISPGGSASVEEMALMAVTSTWIPVEDDYDKQLVELLSSAGRRFNKALRYNLASDRPLASAVAVDTIPQPVALYILPAGAEQPYRDALRDLIDSSSLAPWLWKAGDERMPDLPSLRDYEPLEIELETVPAEAKNEALSEAGSEPHGDAPTSPEDEIAYDELEGVTAE